MEQINIGLNYADLIWMLSLANGSLTFLNLTTITTVRTTKSELIKRKQKIIALATRLQHHVQE